MTNRNTYIQNTDAPDNETYPENIKEINQLRYATFQSTPTTTTETEHILKSLKPKNS
jgi:hypothetical protein